MQATSPDPFALVREARAIPLTYELDAMPTRQQAALLWRIKDGDRIVTAPNGKGFAWERGPGRPHRATVNSCIDNCSITHPCPDGPCFGEQYQGRLTVRGQHALLRYQSDR